MKRHSTDERLTLLKVGKNWEILEKYSNGKIDKIKQESRKKKCHVTGECMCVCVWMRLKNHIVRRVRQLTWNDTGLKEEVRMTKQQETSYVKRGMRCQGMQEKISHGHQKDIESQEAAGSMRRKRLALLQIDLMHYLHPHDVIHINCFRCGW